MNTPKHDAPSPAAISTQEVMQGLFKVAARTPVNIAPERQDQLRATVFKGDPWTLTPTGGSASFSAVPADKALYASWAGQASLWCLSFAAFQIMDIASRAARDPKFASEHPVDFGAVFGALQLAEYVAFAKSLFRTDQPWPEALVRPAARPPEGSEEWRVDNLYLGALAWVLLHEIGHVHHDDQEFVTAPMRMAQEFRADRFATEWVLGDAGHGLKREYRVLSIIVAMSWLFLNEIQLGRGRVHPAAILRFREATQEFSLGDRSVTLESASYLLKALFDPETLSPAFETSREAFDWITTRLESIFPAR